MKLLNDAYRAALAPARGARFPAGAARARLALGGIALALWIAASGGSASALVAKRTIESENWAGYVVTRHGSFSRVIGEWVQPSGHCRRGHQGFSAFWVGIGGYSAKAHGLEQIGTDLDCGNEGHANAYAWYELIPAAPIDLPLKVHAGDRLAASVTISESRAALHIRNLTTGRSFQTSRHVLQLDTGSAEWIAEAPTGCGEGSCRVLPLADFGSVTFTGASAYAGPIEGPIADPLFSFTEVRLGDEGGLLPGGSGTPKSSTASSGAGAVASVSELAENGKSFSVTWRH